MSEETREPVGSNPVHALAATNPLQNVRVELNMGALATAYTNFFRVTGTFEELILDFGMHTGAVLPNGPEPVKLSQRMILSFPTAKRLLASLQVALARHEQVFGNVETDPNKRAKRNA